MRTHMPHAAPLPARYDMLDALEAGDGTCDLAVAGVDISRINLEKARGTRAGRAQGHPASGAAGM